MFMLRTALLIRDRDHRLPYVQAGRDQVPGRGQFGTKSVLCRPERRGIKSSRSGNSGRRMPVCDLLHAERWRETILPGQRNSARLEYMIRMQFFRGLGPSLA